ncbi:MAG: hypothetical protein WC236_07375 [Gallionellaceae bacterium]|jgi:hypothetical protein
METENHKQVGQSESDDGDAKRTSLFQRLRRHAYRKFPAVFPDPDCQRRLAIWQRRDEEENKKSSPPDDELIQLHALSVAEIYTSSHVEKLLSGLKSLGWHQDESLGSGGDPVAWIRRNREASLGGGWLNLGGIQRAGLKRFIGPSRVAQLPEHVQYALGKVYGLTSSITCIVMTFVYEDDYALRFDVALRAERRTYTEPRRRGNQIVQPFFQKANEVRAIRREAENDAAEWFRGNLPGLFSSGVLEGQFPSYEFITLDKAVPFATEREEYLRALNVENDIGAWNSDELPGLRFAQPASREDEGFHAILAIRKEQLEAQDLRSWGGSNRGAYVGYLEEHLHGLLSRWALLAVIAGFERTLNVVRDSALLSVRRNRNARKAMSKMSGLISAGIDIATIAADLRQVATKKAWFEGDLPKFSPSTPKYYAPEMSLARALREEIEKRAGKLQETDRSIRDLIIQHGTMLSATESMNLQNRVAILTWVLVILTIVITVLTAVAAYEPLLGILGYSVPR